MHIFINHCEVEIPAGKRMNAIEAARLIGAKIPHYCWHPSLSIVGSCRMCLVEVGTRDPKTGVITMQPKLTPACNTIVTDNMVIVTDSEKVARTQAMVEEGLLLRHPIDCPICDKAGECKLQDYHFQYGQPERRADLRPFTSRRRDIGDVTLFVDRCVLCSRCVRFTREISGTDELMFIGRGAHEEIDIVPGFPLNNKLSGNVVDLCPVGALGDKDFLYQQRVWFLQQHPGICTGCATGCSIFIEENQERIYRIKPRQNPRVNKWWICNDGRYDYPHVHDPRRMTQPMWCENGKKTAVDWTGLASEIDERLRKAKRLAGVISPHLTVEEAYLLCHYLRSLDPEALLVLGRVPVVGENENFPNGFTIAAEKCPNRRGVEAVIAHFAKRVAPFEELLAAVEHGDLRGVWASGGYKDGWIDEATTRRFGRLELLIVQDLFPSPLSDCATYALPGTAYAERDGSYVNRADRLQSAAWAIRPPQGVRTEGSFLWELSGRKGLYNSAAVLDEIAQEILYFSAVIGPVPETGLDLRVNLLAKNDGMIQSV
jgi:NADH-quinone oxidoreductase subunit G